MVQAETEFPPDEAALSDLERAFTVNQYKAAMQLLRLTAPNPSSHVGIPSHVGDPTRKTLQVDKAHAIFDEMKDHQAMGMTMRVGAGKEIPDKLASNFSCVCNREWIVFCRGHGDHGRHRPEFLLTNRSIQF